MTTLPHPSSRIHCEVKSVDKPRRTVYARISANVVDRDGEVLLPGGCDYRDFIHKSPSVFYVHNYSMPVGRCEEIIRGKDFIEARTTFPVKPDGHQGEWLPDTLLHLFDQKVIYGFSVGFDPIESRDATRADISKYGPECKRVYTKWKLLEYSVAPMPCNPDALATAVSKALGCPSEHVKLLMPSEPGTQTANDDERDTLVMTKQFIEQTIDNKLQTSEERFANIIKTAFETHLDAGVGGPLHMLIADIAESMLQASPISKAFDDDSALSDHHPRCKGHGNDGDELDLEDVAEQLGV